MTIKPIYDLTDRFSQSFLGIISSSFYLLEISPEELKGELRTYNFAKIRRRGEHLMYADIWKEVYLIEGLKNLIANPKEIQSADPNAKPMVLEPLFKQKRPRRKFSERIFLPYKVSCKVNGNQKEDLVITGKTHKYTLSRNKIIKRVLEEKVLVHCSSIPPTLIYHEFYQRHHPYRVPI